MIVNPIPILKEAASVLKTAGNLDLYAKLMGLMTTIIDLKDENQQLREQLRDRTEADELRAKRDFRENAYWLGETGPYCTACWDKHDKPVRMHVVGAGQARCPVCNNACVYDRAAKKRADDEFQRQQEANAEEANNDRWY